MRLLLAMAAVYAAWACAALAMPGHRQAVIGPRTPPAMVLRILALMLAVTALVLCVSRDGAAMGVLLWACVVCVDAWLVVLTLAWLGTRSARRP